MLRPANRKRSKIQEAKAAQSYGGKTTPGSGNQWHSKGDIKTDRFLIECKTTLKSSYSINIKTWRKIWWEAISEGRDPFMEIQFENDNTTLIILDKEDFLNLIGRP